MPDEHIADFFAAHALQAVIVAHHGGRNAAATASEAWDIAEAMMAERQKRNTKRDHFGRVVG